MTMQSLYNTAPAVAIEGMVADSSRQLDVLSRAANDAIPAGRLVVRQAEGKCKLPVATGEITGGTALGVAMYDALRAAAPYAINDMVPVIHGGRVWVKVEEAVTEGGAVFVRFASGAGGTGLGAFRASADTATAVALPGAVYRSSASANGLAIVELNLP